VADGAIVALSSNDGWSILNNRSSLIRFLLGAGYRVAVLAPEDEHSSAIRALGVDFRPVPMTPRGLSPLADARTLLAYRRQLRAAGAQAFLGFTIKPNIYGSLAARMLRIPVINNITGLGAAFAGGGWLSTIVRSLYRAALRRSATVFFQNAHDKSLFESEGLVAARQAARLPGSGVDLAHFAPQPRKTGGPITFLLPARLLWDKGIDEFVEAARRLRAGRRDLRFQILGFVERPSPAALPKAKLHEWDAEGIVEYLGSASDVRPVFAEADCIVLPTYYREGVPRVLLEASAMGLPVIASDWPGCVDAVDDGVTGLLCQPRSAENLAAAMARIAGMSAGERAAMGQAGRAKMEREFGEEIIHRAYLDALIRAGVHPA
jgi:glycosyltransferase involved in cell wall biosynthesis